MTFIEGITLGIGGTILTLIGFWLAFQLANIKDDKEKQEQETKKKNKKLFTWLS